MTHIGVTNDSHLEHHGVKGMKWGVRRHRRQEKRIAKYQKMYGDTPAQVYGHTRNNGSAQYIVSGSRRRSTVPSYIARGRSYQISRKTYDEMNKRGLLDANGNVLKDKRGEARMLVSREGNRNLAAALGLGTAAIGAMTAGVIYKDTRGRNRKPHQ